MRKIATAAGKGGWLQSRSTKGCASAKEEHSSLDLWGPDATGRRSVGMIPCGSGALTELCSLPSVMVEMLEEKWRSLGCEAVPRVLTQKFHYNRGPDRYGVRIAQKEMPVLLERR